jgi:hypothetical protein
MTLPLLCSRAPARSQPEREVVQDQQLDPGEAAHLGVQGVVQPGGFEALEQLRSWRRPLAGGNDLTRTPRAERVSNPVKE